MTLAPTVSLSTRPPDDADLSVILSRVKDRLRHTCAHCQQPGTTASGALWRASAHAQCNDLYYLHSECMLPYKAAHGLLAVEGRIPRQQRAVETMHQSVGTPAHGHAMGAVALSL